MAVVAERARCELLSSSNSLINRENTGNFSDFGFLGPAFKPKKPCLPSGFCPNSLPNGRGNFEPRTGNYFAGTGNFPSNNRENSSRWCFEEPQDLFRAGSLQLIEVEVPVVQDTQW